MAAAMCLSAPAFAEEANVANTGTYTTSQDKEAMAAATQTRLAYIRTGNNTIDQMNEAGLRGLGIMLFERTAVENSVRTRIVDRNTGAEKDGIAFEPVTPVGVDIENSALAFYPILFWTIDPGQSLPSEKAVRNLNNYMRNGGMLVIDTRDKTTNGRGMAWLRGAISRGLAIGPLPAMDEVQGCESAKEECHVLGKSFYLMDDFPGRYAGSKLLVEHQSVYDEQQVSSVVIGGNEWTAAWATDEEGRYLYAVVGDEEQREHAFRFGINLVMYALTGNYKANAVHAPALLERMGPK